MKSGADSLPDDPVLLKALVLQLQEQVALLRHKLFSPKSERSPEDADSPQLAMFNEAVLLQESSLPGDLAVPARARGLVLFAHGSGSSRLSPRNQEVARVLQAGGIATLLMDLLTEEEAAHRAQVFDIEHLADRLEGALAWSRRDARTQRLAVGFDHRVHVRHLMRQYAASLANRQDSAGCRRRRERSRGLSPAPGLLNHGDSQFSTARPGTRLNSLTLSVTSTAPRASACAAIHRSLPPIDVPCRSSPARIRAYCELVAASSGGPASPATTSSRERTGDRGSGLSFTRLTPPAGTAPPLTSTSRPRTSRTPDRASRAPAFPARPARPACGRTGRGDRPHSRRP